MDDQPDTLNSSEVPAEKLIDSDSIHPVDDSKPVESILEPNTNNNNSYLDLDQSDLYKNDMTNELIIDESAINESVNDTDALMTEAKKETLNDEQNFEENEEVNTKMETSENICENTSKGSNSNEKGSLENSIEATIDTNDNSLLEENDAISSVDSDQAKLDEVSEEDKKEVEAVLEQATELIVSEDLKRQLDEKASNETENEVVTNQTKVPSNFDANMEEIEADNCEEKKNDEEVKSESKVAGTLAANFGYENKADTENVTSKQGSISGKNDTVTCVAKTNGSSNGTSMMNSVKSDKSLSYYRSLSGKIRKFGSSYVFKQENIKSYTDTFGIVYKIGDHVYMDINKPNQPFAVACVLDFKLTKRDNVVIEVRWYFRPNEIPDSVYIPLMQDRITEIASVTKSDLAILEPKIKGRELFASESTDIYPATFIKGKSRVFHYQDILDAKNFKPFADTFFCILTYNPEARRLANTNGEIRVGPSHQAKFMPCSEITEPLSEAEQRCDMSETVLWDYKAITDTNLFAYLQAARSIAAFAGMCERGNQDDMYGAAQSDSTTINALNVLNETRYNTSRALKILVNNKAPKSIEHKWSEDDQKKFVKGLGQYGKNFFRIRRELLHNKTTSELVEFYYLWKKTSAAQNNRFRRRLRPSSNISKKMSQIPSNKKTSASINTINNANNASSGSDMDSDNNDSDESSDQKQTSSAEKCCTNCFTNSSKDLQNGGLDNQLLCYDCRMYYKKYGELPRIPNTKSENQFLSNECEFTNQLDKLESDNRIAYEMALKQKSLREEALKSEEKNSKRPNSEQSDKSGESVKTEAKPTIDKVNQLSEKSEDKLETSSESDEELGEVRFSKLAKQQNDQSDKNRDLEHQQILENRTNLARSHIEQAMSSFMPVASASKLLPGDLANTKPNVSSSSPKPAFSPMNFMNSPGPSQSPIPSFNPLNMPFNPLSHSAFSHFFPPEMQHQFQQQQQNHQKSQNQSNSTSSSPTPDQQDDQRAPIPCKIAINKPVELLKPESNAMFVRVWDRGSNTCSRTDLNFKYLPNSNYMRTKAEKSKQPNGKSSANGNFNDQHNKNNNNSNNNINNNNNNNNNNKPPSVNSTFNPDLNKPQVGNPLMNMAMPPHLAPFFNMMANAPNRPIGPNAQENEMAFLNELLKSQFMNPNLNSVQMGMANAQQQQLAKQAHQQKLAFTESQILEQAKKSLENSLYSQLNNGALLNGVDMKNSMSTNPQKSMPLPHQMNNSQQQQKFQMPPKFNDMNPALKQLRDIADARSNVGGMNFPGMNPNAFNNNSFNKNFF